MYLTRMYLDVARRDTMRALQLPNLIHGAVESAFTGERRRNLWRIDRLGGRYCLLILSEEKPELSAAARQFGDENESPAWETRDYSPLLDRVAAGGRWRFKLCANPVICKSEYKPEKGGRGKVCALVGAEGQRKWLLDRAQSYGFSVEPQEFGITRIDRQSFQKGASRRRVSLLAVTYEGLLTVTDERLFRQSLCEGIGRGKAYGAGMLTIVGG